MRALTILIVLTVLGCSKRETSHSNGESQIQAASNPGLQDSDSERLAGPAETAPGLNLECWPGHYSGHRDHLISGVSRTRLLRVSPAGRYLAVARSTGQRSSSLELWEIDTGKLLDEVFSSTGVTAIDFTPDDKMVGYGTGDRDVLLLEISTRKVRRLSGHRLQIRRLSFSPDGQRLVTVGDDKRLIAWDVDQGVKIAESIDEGPAATVAFGDSSHVWTWNGVDVIRWYEVATGRFTLQSTDTVDAGGSIGTARGMLLCVANGNHLLKVIDARDRHVIRTSTIQNSVADDAATDSLADDRTLSAVCLAAESNAIAAGFPDGKVTIWSGENATAPRTIAVTRGAVRLLSVDDKGKVFAAGSESGGLSVFRPDKPSDVRSLDAARFSGMRLVAPRFSRNAESLVDLADSGLVRLVHVRDGEIRFQAVRAGLALHGQVRAMCFGPAESAICGTDSGHVELLKPDVPNEIEHQISDAPITALACRPGGDIAIAGDEYGRTIWFDPFGARPAQGFSVHASAIVTTEFSSRGRWAATVDQNGVVRIWDALTRQPREPLSGLQAKVRAVAFSFDEQLLATGDESGAVVIWDVKSSSQRWSWTMAEVSRKVRPGDAARNSLPDRLTEWGSSVKEAASHSRFPSGISTLRFRDDGEVLAAGSVNGYVQTINIRQKRPLSLAFHQTSVSDLAFDRESLLVATMAGDVFRCWQESEPPLFLAAHRGPVRFAALDAGGQRAVTGGHDKRLCIWDVESGSLSAAIENDGESIAGGALSPDGLSAVTSAYGSGVVFWDLGSMKRLAKMYGHQKRVQSLAFSADGKLVASGDDAGVVKVWDFATRRAKRTIQHEDAVHFVAFSPDGTRLLTTTLDPRGWQFPSRVRLSETETGKLITELKGHRAAVNSAAFSSNGQTVTACGADGQICRWNPATGELVNESSQAAGLSHLGLVDDGRTLVARRFNDGILFYNSESLKQVAEFDVATRLVGDLGIASRGNRVIAGTNEGAAYIWNVRRAR